MKDRFYLGLDLGSVSLDAVVVDQRRRICWWRYRRVRGWPQKALHSVLRELIDDFARPRRIKRFEGVLATGSGKEIVQEELGITAVNEIVAHGMAALREAGGEASVIEIGGQDSKFIQVDGSGPGDYSMNELCAAGTGAFLDVQAERLGISIEELSQLAARAEHIPSIAGRCSVFAKSDIIHLQQKGTPLEEIVAGLCYALARNYIATLIRGREIRRPVVFQGGVSLNDGVVRAFRELLELTEEDIIRPEMPHLMGAIGAGIMAAEWESERLSVRKIAKIARKAHLGSVDGIALGGWELSSQEGRQDDGLESFAIEPPDTPPETSMLKIDRGEESADPEVKGFFLGLDVGSVSTDAVLIGADGSIAARVYAMTRGKPLDAAARIMAFLLEHFDGGQVRAAGVTGSGRKLVGHILGADVIIDEISAQARGASVFFPEVDTVMEIGGQDAKFIRMDGRRMVRMFEMNRACSAGTGSFIQEQAARLSVDLRNDFASLALSSKYPVPLANRCTVFMESDLVHHVQRGAALPDLLRGVSLAVVDNYMGRVALGRVPGKLIVLQGGVAKNAAVVEAFRKKLGDSEVMVHPWPELSGALGVAALAAERTGKGDFKTTFKGFDVSGSCDTESFTCRGCENRCEVNVFITEAGRFHFGDLCGRYSERHRAAIRGTDHTNITRVSEHRTDKNASGARTSRTSGHDQERAVRRARGEPVHDRDPHDGTYRDSKARIGIPRALLYHEYHHFWDLFFRKLGIDTITSPATSDEIFSLGLSRLPAETCMPVKILFGHVASLVRDGIKRIFVPGPGRMWGHLPCPYVQHAPAMISSVFRDTEIHSFALVPFLDEPELRAMASEVSRSFSVPEENVLGAYATARSGHEKHLERLILDTGTDGERPLAVIIGKPYTRADRFLNLALPSKLAGTGFDVAFSSQLHQDENKERPLEPDNVGWYFNRSMIEEAARVMEDENRFPVVITTFGCGPDSFTIPLLEETFGERPALFLEMDEHRADAGLETRIEAFHECVRQWRERRGPTVPTPTPTGKILPGPPAGKQGGHYIIPRFSDHAFAFAGALRAAGFTARVLPLPDRSVLDIGAEISGGKQCHPFQLISGDIVRLAVEGELPLGATYLFPVLSCSTCLINQYVPAIRRYLNRVGRSDVMVMGTTTDVLYESLGAMNLLNLGRGIVGVEYLLRLRHEIRPYEIKKNRTDRAYDRAMKMLVERLSEGKAHEGITEAIGLMEKVRTAKRGSRPVIGVAGDVYTRINPQANAGLFRLLEKLGCEVWISPTIFDISMAGAEMSVKRSWKYREYWNMTYSWASARLMRMEMWRIQKRFRGILKNLDEPDLETIEKYIDGLLPGDPELLVILNVAKHMDFAEKGVDGILNVFCLNCMVGTSTAAVLPAIKERTGNVPMMSLVFDGLGNTHTRNRIEAFVHRVKRNHRERMEARSRKEEGSGGGMFDRLKERVRQLGWPTVKGGE